MMMEPNGLMQLIGSWAPPTGNHSYHNKQIWTATITSWADHPATAPILVTYTCSSALCSLILALLSFH